MFNLFKSKPVDKYLDAIQAKNLTIESKPKAIQKEVKLLLSWIREQAERGDNSLHLTKWGDSWSWHMKLRKHIYLRESIQALIELNYEVVKEHNGDYSIYWGRG